MRGPEMRPDPRLCLAFAADAVAVRRALATLLAAPPLAHRGADDRAVAELVLAEVLNNVVEHAYAGAAGRIVLRLRARAAGLSVCIVDRGRPMPDGRLPAVAGPPFGGAVGAGRDLPQGGFGWPLIRTLADGLRYRRHRGYNVLYLRLRMDSGAGPGGIVSQTGKLSQKDRELPLKPPRVLPIRKV